MHFFALFLLYIILWFKGNAKPLFNINMQPWQWWLTTGLITNYLGITSWWILIDKYGVWTATALTYAMHTVIEMSLNAYFFDAPTTKQIIGISLLIFGGYLTLK